MAHSATDHQAYHHGDLPKALLAAVGEIIGENGAANVSLREAARRAGVSHSAPAHHFGDKDGMLMAFGHQGFEILESRMQEAFEAVGDSDPERRISVAGDTYVRFADAHRAHFDVMFRTGLPKVEDASHDEFEQSGSMELLNGLVDELVEAGHVSQTEAQGVAVCLWSSAHGLACLWVDGAIARMYPDMLLDDLLDIAFGSGRDVLGTVLSPVRARSTS